MRLRVLSDLHLDFDPDFHLELTEGTRNYDWLLIAGDLVNFPKRELAQRFLQRGLSGGQRLRGHPESLGRTDPSGVPEERGPNEQVVVMTHHLPSFRCIAPKYAAYRRMLTRPPSDQALGLRTHTSFSTS